VTARRLVVVALVLAGLGAGIAAGAPRAHPSIASPCPLAAGTVAPTLPCCGPPRATAQAVRAVPEVADQIPCPGPCGTTPCTVPTVPNPTPLPSPKLAIPRGGIRVRHGHFSVRCSLAGGSGPCGVTATAHRRRIGQGTKKLSSGRARVTVRLVVAGRAMLMSARHHTMRAKLTAVAGGRRTTATATLKG
jgi:hypothetical protein